MLVVKKLITLSFICSLFVCSSTSWAMIKSIDSIESLENKVKSLRKAGVNADEICVVFDFHGVIVEQEMHQKNLTLKGNIKKTLAYLKNENIPNLVATAWDDFNAVIKEGIVPLKLQDFFDVDPNYHAPLMNFKVSSEQKKILGHKNGRVFALKNAKSKDAFFRQKAFAVELAYPKNEIKYIFFVDDSEDNLITFSKDSSHIYHTESLNFKQLFLYQLTNIK